MSPQQLDHIEAVSCLREADRSAMQALAMLYYLPAASGLDQEVDTARAHLLRTRKALRMTLAKITKTQQAAGDQVAVQGDGS